MNYRSLLMVVLIASAAPLAAAVVPGWDVERWTAKNGLPSDSINDLLQSRDGYVWIATWNGLARFDGVRFTRYHTSTHPDLESNRLTTIHESSDGSLWLSTEQHHLVRFRNGRFTTYGARDGLPGDEIHALYAEDDGTLWAGGNAGAARFDGGEWKRIAPDLIRDRVLSILRDRAGNLWFGTSPAGVKRLAGGKLTTWNEEHGLDAREVLALLETRSGQILAGTTEGLFRLEGERWEEISLGDGEHAVHAIEESDGRLWLATADGIIRQEGTHFRREPNSAPWIFRRDGPFSRDRDDVGWSNSGNRLDRAGIGVFETADLITSTLHDHEGNVWIGTWESGLYRVRASRFTIYGREEGLASAKVYPIAQDRSGNIWVGTLGGGLARFDDGRFEVFSPPVLVYSLAQDSSGTFWVGGDALCIFDDGRCSTAAVPPLLRNAVEVRAIFGDRSGRLWIGSKSGLFVRERGAWRQLGAADGVPEQMVRVFAETADGSVWMGTNGGGLLRHRDGRVERLTAANGLPSDVIRSIHEQPRGTLWVGTEARGVARLTGADGAIGRITIDTIDRRGGLFSGGIHQILSGGDGRIWMSSNDGIFHVSAAELLAFRAGGPAVHSVAYTERDGIEEPNGGVHGAGIRSADGRLWFPTQGGVAVVDPLAAERQSVLPPVIIEAVRTGERSFVSATAVDLEPEQRTFQIDYTAISFADAERVRFRYRLEGYDSEWIDAGERRSAYYSKVPAGRYRFVVQAQRGDGAWSESGAAMSAVIRPYLREMIWFRLLIVAAVAAALPAVILWRTRHLAARQRELEAVVADRTVSLHHEKARAEEALARVEEQNEALGRLDDLKTRFFADASHELRTPLTLIAGPLTDVLDEKHGAVPPAMRHRLTVMKRNTLRLHRLVNQMLDLHRLEAGGLRLQRRTRDLRTFVRDVATAFFPLAERHQIEMILDLDDEPCLVSFDADQMEKIVANLLSNPMKYARAGGRITVTVRRDGEGVRLAVADDGSGIPADEVPHVFNRFYRGAHVSAMREGTGIGLALVHELVQQHGGTIDVRSEPDVETVFAVRLPQSEEVSADGDEPVPERLFAEWHEDEETAAAMSQEDSTTVMVVEDNHDVRNYIRDVLAPDYRVITAVDGRQALEAVARELPDLIISDVLMPNLDGLAFCSALRANPDTECIPVILLTALASAADEVAGIRTGADEYLVKPFSSDALRARVEGLLAQRHRLRKKIRSEIVDEYARVRPHPAEGTTARVRAFILDHLDEEDLSVERIVAGLATSRSALHRALQLEGTTASELVRITRVERAAELLLAGSGSITEIGFAVGFQSLAHFSRCFRQRFGLSPSQYASMARSRVDDGPSTTRDA